MNDRFSRMLMVLLVLLLAGLLAQPYRDRRDSPKRSAP